MLTSMPAPLRLLLVQVATLKVGHRQQLDLVEVRVQAVLGKKDSVIAALRAELATMGAQLAQLQGLAV